MGLYRNLTGYFFDRNLTGCCSFTRPGTWPYYNNEYHGVINGILQPSNSTIYGVRPRFNELPLLKNTFFQSSFASLISHCSTVHYTVSPDMLTISGAEGST